MRSERFEESPYVSEKVMGYKKESRAFLSQKGRKMPRKIIEFRVAVAIIAELIMENDTIIRCSWNRIKNDIYNIFYIINMDYKLIARFSKELLEYKETMGCAEIISDGEYLYVENCEDFDMARYGANLLLKLLNNPNEIIGNNITEMEHFDCMKDLPKIPCMTKFLKTPLKGRGHPIELIKFMDGGIYFTDDKDLYFMDDSGKQTLIAKTVYPEARYRGEKAIFNGESYYVFASGKEALFIKNGRTVFTFNDMPNEFVFTGYVENGYIRLYYIHNKRWDKKYKYVLVNPSNGVYSITDIEPKSDKIVCINEIPFKYDSRNNKYVNDELDATIHIKRSGAFDTYVDNGTFYIYDYEHPKYVAIYQVLFSQNSIRDSNFVIQIENDIFHQQYLQKCRRMILKERPKV